MKAVYVMEAAKVKICIRLGGRGNTRVLVLTLEPGGGALCGARAERLEVRAGFMYLSRQKGQ